VERKTIFIKANAIYQLAGRSSKPAAVAFTRWVYGEVLPSILKTGAYVDKRRERYQKQGKQIDWVEEREEGIG
jgi:prophage antirepressor-like protein